MGKRPVILFLILAAMTGVAGPTSARTQDSLMEARVDSLIRQGYFVMNLKLDSAQFYAEQAQKISDETGYTAGRIKAMMLSAAVTYRKGRYLNAINDFFAAASLCKTIDDIKYSGFAYQMIGQIMLDVGQYEQASFFLTQAIRLAIRSGDTSTLIEGTYNTGLVSLEYGDRQKARNLFYYGFYLSEKAGYHTLALRGLRLLGSMYLGTRDLDQAFRYYSLAADYAEKNELSFAIGSMYAHLAHARKLQGRYREALAFDLRSLGIRMKYKQEEQVMSSLLNVADDYYRIGLYDSSRHYLTRGLAMLAGTQYHYRYFVYAYRIATDIAKKSGNYKEALAAFEKYSIAGDSVQKEAGRQEISIIETKERLVEIEQKNRLLEYQNTMQDLRIKYNNRVRALYLTVIGVVLLLLIIFTRLYFRARRSRAALEVLNRKLDIEMAERGKAQAELRESETAYRFLADNTPDMIVQLDRMGVVRYVSPSFRTVMGYSPGGNDGDFGIIDTIHPEYRDEMTRLFLVMIESKKPMLYKYRAIDRTGNIFWVESLANPTFDPSSGEYTGSIAVIRNIEERVKYEEQLARNARQKELLLREIHHRVKNNFAILSGVMTLQQYSADNPELTALVSDLHIRIRSMSLVHELLYRNDNLDVIPFHDYLAHLSQIVAAGYRSRPVNIITDFEPCSLDIEVVLPLGLVVSEILTNAFKHAFSEADGNAIRLELRVAEKDETGHPLRWRLTVADNGKGLPDDFSLESRATLGTQIVRMLVQQVEGTVEVRNEGGTCYDIFFSPVIERSNRLKESN